MWKKNRDRDASGNIGSNHKKHNHGNGGGSIHLRYIFAMLVCSCINVMVQLRLQRNCIGQVMEDHAVSNRLSVDEGAPLFHNATATSSPSPTTNSTIANSTAKYVSQQNHPHADPCVQEYGLWTADRLPGLTKEDLLRSRTYLGNRYRLATLANKLGKASVIGSNGETSNDTKRSESVNPTANANGNANAESFGGVAPIKAVVCGGSISLGHGVKTPYSKRLQTWLNDRFPVSSGSQQHEVINKGFHGSDICAMAKRANKLIEELGPDVDLFILEFAVNDYQGQDHVTQIEDRMDVFFDGFQDLATCTEAVLIKLLAHYPEAAILFLELRTGVLSRPNGAVLHMGAAQHYQVPVVSYEQALWPDFMEVARALKDHHYAKLYNDTVLPFPHGCHACDLDGMEDDELRQEGCLSLCDLMEWNEGYSHLNCTHPPPGREPCYVPFLAHDEVHPSGIGHTIAADLIIDAIATTKLDLCHQLQEAKKEELTHIDSTGTTQQGFPKTLLEKKAGLPMTGWMVHNPQVMNVQTDFLWVNDTYVIFTDQDELVPSSHTDGFELLEDKYERWGWIATNEAGNESITFEIDLPTVDATNGKNKSACYIPHLAVLKSYENMGQMTVRVYDRIQDREILTEIDSLWEPRISVPHDVQLVAPGEVYYEEEDGCSGKCSVTITSKPMVEGREGNKIKIVTFSVRPCVPREWLED